MKLKLKNLGFVVIGIIIASIIWSFFTYFIPVGSVDGHTIYKYELDAKLNQSAGNAVKNIGRDIAFNNAMCEIGIEIQNDEIQKEFNAMVERYGGVCELENILLDTQSNIDTLKISIRKGLLKQKAIEYFAKKANFSQSDLTDFYNANIVTYSDFKEQYSKIREDYIMEKGAEMYDAYIQEFENKVTVKIY